MEDHMLNEDPYKQPIFYRFRPDNAEELKRCVAEAFADAVYPGDGDGDIIVSGCPGCCAECRETHGFFRGKHWREIAESQDGLHNLAWNGLALLTPPAWLFYLPAYLTVSLSGDKGAEEALDCALSALTPWPPEGLAELGGGVVDYVKLSTDWFSERAFNFSSAQTACLAAYLSAVSVSNPQDMRYADLATYWKDRAAEAKAQQVMSDNELHPPPHSP